jgi:hypothetical protein
MNGKLDLSVADQSAVRVFRTKARGQCSAGFATDLVVWFEPPRSSTLSGAGLRLCMSQVRAENFWETTSYLILGLCGLTTIALCVF